MSESDRHWIGYLTKLILPTNQQIQQLEQVREALRLDHEAFADLVQRSPASLRRVCVYVAAKVKWHHPDASSTDLLSLTYSAVVLTIKLAGTNVRVSYRPEEFQTQTSSFLPGMDRHLASVMRQVKSMDDLVEYMLTESEFEAYAPEPDRKHQDEVDRILGWHGKNSVSANRASQVKSYDPAWLSELPPNLRPDNRKVNALEELREQSDIPYKVFADLVLQSPGITKLMFEQQFADFRQKRPYATDKELFDAIIQFRYFTTDISDGMTPEEARERLQQPWRQAIVKSVVEEVNTIDDLAHYIVEEYEDFWKHTADPYGVNPRIAEILGYSK